ncbi:MAG: hypothetical protein IJZ67_09475, partial [Alistipes sp.]|nr:hypothetical protein [Alistipes sp.]
PVEFTATPMTAADLAAGHLSMNYLLAPADGCVADVAFTFNNDKNVAISGTTYTNVPLKANYRTNIIGALLTNSTDFTVEIEADFNKADQVVATDAAAAQEALDNAVPGTVIKLKSGVNYGTLYLRPVAGGAQTKVVDWQGNNYHWETYSCFENITIIGAEGATVDAIKIEGGTYYNTEHSQAATYPVMLSLVELKNVVLDGVTFTGKGGYDPQGYGNAINLSGSNIKVDGLTLKNCVLNNSENNARLLYKTESTTHVHTYTYDGNTFTFTPSLKDITVTGCTFNGGYMGLELRETENVTITNNVFEVGNRNILLPVNSGCTYTGNVTITGNTSNNAKERFVRMAGAGDAVVVIKDNIINNYLGADSDFIKVTDGTNVTIENNTLANSTTVTVPDSNTQDVVVSTGTTQVTVPASAAQAGDNYKVVVSNDNITTDSVTGETTVAFDLTLYKNDVKVSGDVVYAVTKNIGAGLFISEVTHNGTALTKATTGADQTYTYDAATGVLTIYTKSFSPFAVTHSTYKEYIRTLNRGHNINSSINISTGGDLLPIVAVMPEIFGYSVFDGDTRIANAVHFCISNVKKEAINENSYKVAVKVEVKDENGNNLELKSGSPYNTGKEYLNVYMNLIEIPTGYSISNVSVNGNAFTLTQNANGNPSTGEYWLGYDPKDVYIQSKTAGVIEITVAKVN